jgi:hypothetical protein
MSRYLETSVYSLDGNSIWDVALKFERLGLQEISKTQNFTFQGQDLNDSQAAFNYKMQFDKLFTLIKEFYVKVNGTQSMYDSINEDIEDEFMKVVINARRTDTVKKAKSAFIKEIREKLEGLRFKEITERLKNKLPLILNAKDDVVLKYAKFEMIIDALNETFKFLEDNDGNSDLIDALASFEDENQETLMDVLKTIEDTYKENSDEVKTEIILGLKEKPELRNRLDIRSTLRLSRYEGSASNVLRDILLTSSSMNQEINNKRLILLESLKQDERLVKTIVDDNKLISEYMKELFNMEEIEKNYMEPFIKVVENMKKINLFVTELKNIDTVVDEE